MTDMTGKRYTSHRVNLNSIERRTQARRIRCKMRDDPPPPLAPVLDAYGISKTQYYRILTELETWEETKATYQQQADEVHAAPDLMQWLKATGEPIWCLVSGRMIKAYHEGEIPNSMLNRNAASSESDIAVQHDPLLG